MPRSYLQLTSMCDELHCEIVEAYSDELILKDTIIALKDETIKAYKLLHLEKLKNTKSRLH